ncbi:MAG: glycoside hydrolase family 32 protein [Erysipelotrichaceae bacterium]|nr:glycoside hydrolase family 32 protein [Erysipelotrichaceae bacterium]
MRPKLHFTPPRNWMNDPNGLIYFRGNYHIFYQHFPYTCQWGTMHWGHATTKDLVNFEHLPIALYPSKDYDRNGCFSGSAIVYNGKLHLYYTAIRYAKENPEFVHVQYSDDDLIASQGLVISDDGFTFDNKNAKHKVVDVITDGKLGDIRHTRDPKVWIGTNGHVYMIIGSKVQSEKGYDGEVLFYESEDGLNFSYKNRFIDANIGDMWECPDLFALDGQYYLVFSPENIDQPPKPNSNAVIMPVAFDETTCTMAKMGEYVYLDYGLDFYAPQTFLDESGRRTLLGWERMREPVRGENWVGMLTMPRVLTQKDGHVYQNVHPNIAGMFTREMARCDFTQPFLLKISLKEGEKIKLGGMKMAIKDDCLCVDRASVSIKADKVSNYNCTPKLNGRYDLEIYYDFQVFEIFINDGFYVLSQVVYELGENILLPESAGTMIFGLEK